MLMHWVGQKLSLLFDQIKIIKKIKDLNLFDFKSNILLESLKFTQQKVD
jgi:hypothetical protein